MISDPNYAFYDFEQAFDKTAYNLLKSNRLEESFFVFSMNADFFPERAGVWNGMGDIYAKQEELQKAREAYQKAVAIDPKGEEGEKARRKLQEL